jgi:hypothetical protein
VVVLIKPKIIRTSENLKSVDPNVWVDHFWTYTET